MVSQTQRFQPTHKFPYYQAIYAPKQAADGLNLRFRPPWLPTAGGVASVGERVTFSSPDENARAG